MEPTALARGLRPSPVIQTDRLNLRAHRRNDLDDLFAYHSMPDVARYIPWPVRDRDQTREALEVKLTQGVIAEPGQWLVLAVELRETSTVIGEVLLKWANEADRQGEIGVALHLEHHGRGLAAEALRVVLRLGFDELGLHRIIAVCVEDNVDSARLLRRLGMRQEARLRDNTFFKGQWVNQLVFGLLENEWREPMQP